MSYYTAQIALSWMALGVLCILVWENNWISGEDKRHFYLTYGIIAASALMEWTGIQLSGNMNTSRWLLSLVKCADYMLTPMAGGAVVAQMKLRNRWSKALMIVLAANAVFQVLSLFTGWMVVIDTHNHYTHGPLYPVYIAVYILVIVLIGAEFLVYGQSYRQQNRASLYAVLLLVIVGIGVQEVLGGEYRTAYIALTLGAALLFIHYAEFAQMTMDERMSQQRSQLMKDPLTGVFSRHAYMKALEKYRRMDKLPEDLAAFTIDINGLKKVNDTIGHEAGDELIIGAARCIEKTFGDDNPCYRTGGDEFVVLAHMGKVKADETLLLLEQETVAWTGESVSKLSLSSGYALTHEHKDLTVEKLVQVADQAMYVAKDAYYRKSGLDRRTAR